MKRAWMGLALTPLTVVAFALPAGAASPVGHSRSSTAYATATWSAETDTSYTETTVDVVSSTSDGTMGLYVSRIDVTRDSEGNDTRIVETMLETGQGFSFAIDAKQLSGATLTAEGLPATTCSFDPRSNEDAECTDTTVSLDVTWTGQGAITRSVINEHRTGGGSTLNVHISGVSRDALASGTVAGHVMDAGELQSAMLAADRQVKNGK